MGGGGREADRGVWCQPRQPKIYSSIRSLCEIRRPSPRTAMGLSRRLYTQSGKLNACSYEDGNSKQKRAPKHLAADRIVKRSPRARFSVNQNSSMDGPSQRRRRSRRAQQTDLCRKHREAASSLRPPRVGCTLSLLAGARRGRGGKIPRRLSLSAGE